MPTQDRFYFRFFVRISLGPVLGLLVGLEFLAVHSSLAEIHPLDRVAHLRVHCGIGMFAGFVIGVFWAFERTKTPPTVPS